MESAMYIDAGLAIVVAFGWVVELARHSDGERLREALAISIKWSASKR